MSSEFHSFKIMPKHWSVKLSFALLEKSRQLLRNCGLLFNARLQFIQQAVSVLYSENFEHVLTAVGHETYIAGN